MKLFSLFFGIFFLFPFHLNGQNLVPNPSFEEVTKITTRWVANHHIFETQMEEWTTPNEGSPDILCEKALTKITPKRKGVDITPYQPRTGKMMTAIKTYGCETFTQHCKEYLQIKLKEPIKKEEEYYLEFWVQTLSNGVFTNNIGMTFSDVEIQDDSEYGIYYFTPQINEKKIVINALNNWHQIKGTVKSDGDYDYIIIGNFFSDDETKTTKKTGAIDYGYYMIDDVLVHPIQKNASNGLSNAKLDVGNKVQLNNILFEIDKATLLPASFTELDQLTNILKENNKMSIQINGHTDRRGDEDYNLELSQKRAQAVMDYISAKGISTNRLSSQGFGESQLINLDDTPESQAINRRVEIIVLSK